MTIPAIIVFVDIRGFTAWSEKTKAFLHMEEFINAVYSRFDDCFAEHFTKKLGDGLMIVQELSEQSLTSRMLALEQIIQNISALDQWFDKHCVSFSEKYGFKTSLKLGWGITSGEVKKVTQADSHDYLGSDINRASRLCSIARPFGIVVDRENFPTMPELEWPNFFEQDRKLEGIADDVCVFVTQEIQEQFLPREKKRESPEVHVTGVCVRRSKGNTEILLAKRDETRRLFPNLYEGCGGQLARNEDFYGGVERHFAQEMNIRVNCLKDFYTLYLIDAHQEPLIPGIRFLCEFIKGEPESLRHSEIRWFSEAEFLKMDEALFPPGLKSEVTSLLKDFHKSN